MTLLTKHSLPVPVQRAEGTWPWGRGEAVENPLCPHSLGRKERWAPSEGGAMTGMLFREKAPMPPLSQSFLACLGA